MNTDKKILKRGEVGAFVEIHSHKLPDSEEIMWSFTIHIQSHGDLEYGKIESARLYKSSSSARQRAGQVLIRINNQIYYGHPMNELKRVSLWSLISAPRKN